MLRFERRADKIFSELFKDTFDVETDLSVRPHLEHWDPGRWKEEFSHASRIFSPQTAVDTARELKKAHEDEERLWGLNDYHYCLIYDLLEDYCAYQNDTAEDPDKPIVRLDGIEIYQIDFDYFTEIYFPDIDFLVPRETWEAWPLKVKEGFGLRPETFSVVMGLKAHPDELRLKKIRRGKFIPRLPPRTIYRPGSKTYPC